MCRLCRRRQGESRGQEGEDGIQQNNNCFSGQLMEWAHEFWVNEECRHAVHNVLMMMMTLPNKWKVFSWKSWDVGDDAYRKLTWFLLMRCRHEREKCLPKNYDYDFTREHTLKWHATDHERSNRNFVLTSSSSSRIDRYSCNASCKYHWIIFVQTTVGTLPRDGTTYEMMMLLDLLCIRSVSPHTGRGPKINNIETNKRRTKTISQQRRRRRRRMPKCPFHSFNKFESKFSSIGRYVPLVPTRSARIFGTEKTETGVDEARSRQRTPNDLCLLYDSQ